MAAATNISYAWDVCAGLTSFPLLVLAAATNLTASWSNIGSGMTSFSTVILTGMTIGTNCFNGTTLTTADYDALLVATEIANSNTVTFHGGSSKYTDPSTAATARQALIADHSWTITDGGAA
jgi:hypothetical protein|tara:strand:- start:320 stop:685 length:366 start_codon:yes stop_codon:yes gene_type:complete